MVEPIGYINVDDEMLVLERLKGREVDCLPNKHTKVSVYKNCTCSGVSSFLSLGHLLFSDDPYEARDVTSCMWNNG